jgi:hypothetical protein
MVFPCSTTVVALLFLRRHSSLGWPAALIAAVGFATLLVSLVIGLLSFVGNNFTEPPEGGVWMWTGPAAFFIPAMLWGMNAFIVSSCVALICGSAVAIGWWMKNRPDRYYKL